MRACQQWTQRLVVYAPQCFAQARNISPTMKGEYERHIGPPCAQHRQWRNQVMIALAVDEIPAFLTDEAIDAGREEVILLLRPCPYPIGAYALGLLKGRQLSAHIRRQNRNLDAGPYQAPANLIDMCLNPSCIGNVTASDHQHAQWAKCGGHP